MYIEARLENIEKQLGALIGLLQSGTAGAGAKPVVAQQVDAAIAADGGIAGTTTEPQKRGRGRPSKTTEAPAAQPVTETKAAEPDPFDTSTTTSAPAEPTRTLEEVRTALIVYQANNDQPKALALIKSVGGADNLNQLKPENYNKLILAALPAGKPSIDDVKAVLVAANARVANSGLEVLKKFGASNIKELQEKDFSAAINEAHGKR